MARIYHCSILPESIQGIVIYIFSREGLGVKVFIRYMNNITCCIIYQSSYIAGVSHDKIKIV
jgi:hypothetical protein